MSPKKTDNLHKSSAPAQSPWALPMILVVVAGFALAIFLLKDRDGVVTSTPPSPTVPTAPGAAQSSATPAPPNEQQTMQVAQAVMVTAELSFPGGVPSIAAALSQIERRSEPSDGAGRTFAILDAYGEPTPDGKLHISMHVSSEKPGLGSLVFRPTGQVLWRSRITGSNALPAKTLNIYVADDSGKSWIIDGTGNPASVLDAKLRDKNIAIRDFWPDGAEREVTFVYSACGCPVKAMVKRSGERTVRTKELPVLFPDDPGAVQTISRLMRWSV